MSTGSEIKRRVGVFWDAENCPSPTDMPGQVAVARIKSVVKHFGNLVEFNAYGDIQFCNLIRKQVELRREGVCVINTPHCTKKQVADMRIIADIIAFALSEVTPATAVLISNDGDFAHAISLIQDKGHSVWIISNRLATSHKLISLADGMMSWQWDVLARITPLCETSDVARSADEETHVIDEERAAHVPNAFTSSFGHDRYTCPIRPVQTSSSSFCANTSTRPFAIQTCSLPSGQSGYTASHSPVSIITTTPAIKPGKPSHKLAAPPRPPFAPSATLAFVNPSTPLTWGFPALSVCSAPPAPDPPDPYPTDKPVPLASEKTFLPLINMLRELRSTDPLDTRRLTSLEIVQMLRRQNPAVFAEHKRPHLYLKRAQYIGIILMEKQSRQPSIIRLHPDYY